MNSRNDEKQFKKGQVIYGGGWGWRKRAWSSMQKNLA